MSQAKEVPITAEDVKVFSEKLDAWGQGLPAKERALLQVMMERAAGSELSEEALDAVSGGAATPSLAVGTFSKQLNTIFSPTLKAGLFASGWVQAGEPWVRGGGAAGNFGTPVM